MNRNMKFAIAAAIASLGVTGQAHALTTANAGASSSLFLYAFEDRGLNSTATNSAVFDLGLATAFDTTKNQTFDFSANSAWSSYISTIANPANIKWGVFGSYSQGIASGTAIYSTFSTLPASVNSGSVAGAIINEKSLFTTYGLSCTACGLNTVVEPGDAASSSWGNNSGGQVAGMATAGLGQNMDFFKYTGTGSKSSSLATQTAYASGGDADYFTLGNNGVLTYTATAAAPVPEADTYALMLAGLGLVGFMVRRRNAA